VPYKTKNPTIRIVGHCLLQIDKQFPTIARIFPGPEAALLQEVLLQGPIQGKVVMKVPQRSLRPHFTDTQPIMSSRIVGWYWCSLKIIQIFGGPFRIRGSIPGSGQVWRGGRSRIPTESKGVMRAQV
jgi:hypothetical protein